MSLLNHMCPKCEYYMLLVQDPDTTTQGSNVLLRSCRNCGHVEPEKKGLVMETIIQGQASESYNVFLNEYTKEDPRLPHVKNLQCPNVDCASRAGKEESDVIYIKYDTINMKFLYICTKCNTNWRSR